MNIKNGLVLVGIVVLACGFLYKKQIIDTNGSGKQEVALILPAVHPSMEAIQKGFIDTLAESMPDVHVVVYNANGNKTLLKGQTEKIVRGNYSACCTIGTNASTMMAAVLDKHHSQMTLIAVAIAPEVSERLMHLYKKVTGITDHADKQKQIESLLAVKKVRKPVLVYDPASNPGFEKDKEEYATIFKTYGITLDSIPVYSMQEVYQKLTGTIASYDLVLTLTDHTVCSAMDAIIKLCNQHGVTLYTSELDSNDKGAALSYGVQEREYGVRAAELLHELQKTGNLPAFTTSGPFYLKINKKAAEMQNVVIPEKLSLQATQILYQGEDHA